MNKSLYSLLLLLLMPHFNSAMQGEKKLTSSASDEVEIMKNTAGPLIAKIFPGQEEIPLSELLLYYTDGLHYTNHDEKLEATPEAITQVSRILRTIIIAPTRRTVHINAFLDLFNILEKEPETIETPLFRRPQPVNRTAHISTWQKFYNVLKTPALVIGSMGCGAFATYMLMKSKIAA